MTKATFADVAREARVGLATVERVLNARGNVSPPLVERVLVASRKLGYGRQFPERYRGTIRIEVVMVRPDTTFFTRLNLAFARIAASLDRSILVHRTFLDENKPSSLAHHIAKPGFRRSGLIVVAPDHPDVQASLWAARDAGVSVVRIVSKSASADGLPFVGIDNYAAGRTAAFYMSKMLKARSGSLVALSHSGAYHGHKERIGGFSDYLQEHPNPAHVFSLVMHGMDEEMLSATLFDEALSTQPNIIGIYNAGGANAAIASVLERHGLGEHVMWVGHELTEQTKRYLKDGLMDIALDQAPEIQARRALDTVLRQLGIIDVEVSTEPVRFLTIVSENV